MRALRFILACVLLCSVAPVFAQETMDEATLRRRMIMAEGKPPDAYVKKIQMTSTLGDQSIVEYHRGIDYRTISEHSMFQTESGRFEGHTWDQNPNGLTTVDELPVGNERPMPTKVAITRVAQPIDAWRESRLDPAGFGRIRYIDPKTFRLLRVEAVTRYGTVTTNYDDFRTIDGHTEPFHWTTHNEVNRIDAESRVVALDVRDVADSDLAIPPDKPFVSFPPDQPSVVLPATFAFDRVILRVMVGDRGLDFILDSGAAGIFIDSEVVKELGLKSSASFSAVTAGRYQTSFATIPEMRVGDLTMRNVAVEAGPLAYDFGPYTLERTKAVGLIGYDFLRSIGVTIDYAHRRATAYPAGKYVPPVMTPESDILPIRLGDHVPEISATINSAPAEHILVDTGASSFMVFDYFALRFPEALSTRVTTRVNNLDYVPQGVGGGFETKHILLQEVDVGRYHLPKIDTLQVISPRRFQFNLDGLVGSDFLEHFTVGFDYAGGKMYLVHNEGQ